MKKLIGVLCLAAGLILMAIYTALAAALGGRIAVDNPILGLVYFALAGILWALPLRPLIRRLGGRKRS